MNQTHRKHKQYSDQHYFELFEWRLAVVVGKNNILINITLNYLSGDRGAPAGGPQ